MAIRSGMVVSGSLAPLARTLRGVDKIIKDETKRAAFDLERTIVLHIQNQDLDWVEYEFSFATPQAGEDYRESKIDDNLSELLWIATGTALETINVSEISKDVFFVGWARGVQNSEGDDFVKIAFVLEFGSLDGDIESRPVVGPSLLEVRIRMEKRMEGAFKKALGL